MYEEMRGGRVRIGRTASREPDDLNVHCVEYLQNRKRNFGSMDHTDWVVVPAINILQAIAPTATRRQFLFWNVQRLPDAVVSRVGRSAGEVAAQLDRSV